MAVQNDLSALLSCGAIRGKTDRRAFLFEIPGSDDCKRAQSILDNNDIPYMIIPTHPYGAFPNVKLPNGSYWELDFRNAVYLDRFVKCAKELCS